MCDCIHYFVGPAGCQAVALPFELRHVQSEWHELRNVMIRDRPPVFSRDEWAYVINFLQKDNLRMPFLQSFGQFVADAESRPVALSRPRGPIAVWLPNNVSLLGPLTLVLLSLTGCSIQIKAASEAEDLTGEFLKFARKNLGDGALKQHLIDRVRLRHFDRYDPRNEELASSAAVRIMFGAEPSLAAIDSLPHPLGSVSFAFSDRQSEAWIDSRSVNPETLTTLIKVFCNLWSGRLHSTSSGAAVRRYK